MRRRLQPGRYVVAVTASFGDPASRYMLSLLIREITSTSLRLAATTGPAGRRPITLRPEVANAAGGMVEIQIDRFDPLTGWHFNRLLHVAGRRQHDLGAARRRPLAVPGRVQGNDRREPEQERLRAPTREAD